MSNNVIYYNNTVDTPHLDDGWKNGFVGVLSQAAGMLGNAPGSTFVIDVALSTFAGVSTEIVTETGNLVLERTDTGTIIFSDNSTITPGDVSLYGADIIIDQALSALITETILIAAGLSVSAAGAPGFVGIAVSLAVAGGVNWYYGKFVDPAVEAALDEIAGTVDVDLRLLDAAGNHVAGVLYKDGIPQGDIRSAIGNLVQEAHLNPDLPSPVAEQKLEVYEGGFLTKSYSFYHDEFMQNIADAFFGGDVDAFLHYSSNGTAKNEDLYVEAAGLFFADDNLNADNFLLPKLYGAGLYSFHPSQIVAGNGIAYGNSAANLLIGGDGSDVFRGLGGEDVLIGGDGHDYFFGNDTDSGLSGSDYFGGVVPNGYSAISTLGAPIEGDKDGKDWIDYSSMSSRVFVDLIQANTSIGGYARALDENNTLYGNTDRLISIENVIGSDHDDIIIGSEIDNRFQASEGNDVYDGQNETSFITHGFSYKTVNFYESNFDPLNKNTVKGDTVDYGELNSDYAIHVNLGDTAVSLYDGDDNYITIDPNSAFMFDEYGDVFADDLYNIENIYDTGNSDVIIGNAKNNVFHYTDGDDVYEGKGGIDYFYIDVPGPQDFVTVDGGDDHDYLQLQGHEEDYAYYYDGYLDVEVYSHKVSGGTVAFKGIEQVIFDGVTITDVELGIGAGNVYFSPSQPHSRINFRPPLGRGPVDVAGPPVKQVMVEPDGTTRIDYTFSFVDQNDPSIVYNDVTCQDWGEYMSPELQQKLFGEVFLFIDGEPLGLIGNDGEYYDISELTEIDSFKPVEDSMQTLFGEDGSNLLGGVGSPERNDILNDWQIDFITTVLQEDIEDVYAAIGQSEATGSPLVLDLDGDGVELISLANSSTMWDIDEDGFAEHTGWVASDDGLLTIDLNGDGMVTDHSELFGSITEDGFTALSVYDMNSDGVIDSNDSQFDDLMVWRDLNQNGISAEAELFTLDDLNIVSIDLNATQPWQMYLEGHHITHTSTFTMDDGVSGPQTHDIYDAWFEYNNSVSVYNQSFTLDPATLTLPNMRGYGNMPTLQIGMSLDNDFDDPDSLISLVTNFTARNFIDFFAGDDSVKDDIRTIMLRWAGVDNVDPSSRGQWADAQELIYLESFRGDEYLQYGGNPNPGAGASESANRAFEVAILPVAGRIIAQAVADDLFEGNVTYDANADTFSGFTGFKQSGLDDLLAKSNDPLAVENKVSFWIDVVRIIDHSIGFDNLSAADYNHLNLTISMSDETLSITNLLAKMQHDIDQHESWTPVGDYLGGTSEDDVYDGTVGDDFYGGGYGNDVLFGGIGDDLFYGHAGNDILNGQMGDDDLRGHSGDDTYLFFNGHGDDVIYEQSGDDKIIFGPEIAAQDIIMTRLGAYDLKLTIDPLVGTGSLTLINQFSAGGIETLEFNDGSILDIKALDYTYEGTEYSETIYGVRGGYGASGVDTLYGYGGDDTIYAYGPNGASATQNYLYGGDGNDTLFGEHYGDLMDGGADDDTINAGVGADIIIGGTGNDTLKGNKGNDVYLFNYGDGNDTIYDIGGTSDILKFGEGITFEMLNIYRVDNNDVMIEIDNGNGGSILLDWQTYGYILETLEFDDGSTVDMSSLSLTLTGTESGETLYGVKVGASQIDTIYAQGGDDIIYGYRNTADYNDNILYGGDGDDTIYGAHGIDLMVGEDGDDMLRGHNGDDVMYGGNGNDNLQGGNHNDILYGGEGDDILLGQNQDDVLDGGLGTDTLTGGGGYDTFVFKADTSFDAIDTITDFSTTYDAIDISDVLTDYDPLDDALADFVQITDNGTDSTLSVDIDGGGDNFVAIALIDNRIGLTDVDNLVTNGQLVTI